MVQGFAILLGFQLAGELLRWVVKWPIPGPVAGMVLLLIALHMGWVRLEAVESGARLLIDHMGLMFVPVGVGLMRYYHLLQGRLLSTVAALIVSTVAALIVTGLIAQGLESGRDAERERRTGNA